MSNSHCGFSDNAFLHGNGFYLRELRESDLAGPWYTWLNDGEVTRLQNKKLFPNTLEKQRTYFESLQHTDRDVVLAIADADSHRHIGNVGLHKIDWIHRSAELGVVIGEKEFWGRGIGKQAWALITKYGFETLNLHRIFAQVAVGNESSAKCAIHAGFREEGRIRQVLYKNGAYHDMAYFNILRADYLEKCSSASKQ